MSIIEPPSTHLSDQEIFNQIFHFAQEALLFDTQGLAMRNALTSMVLVLWSRNRGFPSPAALFAAFGINPAPFAEFFDGNEHLKRIAVQLGHTGADSETLPLETGA